MLFKNFVIFVFLKIIFVMYKNKNITCVLFILFFVCFLIYINVQTQTENFFEFF